jgi:uncharacterized protein YggE
VLTAASPSARITVTGTGALGEPLGPVISITDQAQTQPLPEFAAQASAAKASVPISPGTQQLSVSVTVVFAA